MRDIIWGQRVTHNSSTIEKVIAVVGVHCRRTEQVIIKPLWVLPELIQHPQGSIAPLQDVGELVQVFHLRIDDMHAACDTPPIAIAPTRCLCNGIEPGHETDNAAKVHIHASLDQLRTYAQRR